MTAPRTEAEIRAIADSGQPAWLRIRRQGYQVHMHLHVNGFEVASTVDPAFAAHYPELLDEHGLRMLRMAVERKCPKGDITCDCGRQR